MVNTYFWRLWFKWIDTGDRLEIKNDRIAWIKFVGLPPHLWDEGNSGAITLKLGVISNSMELSMDRVDVSHMKMCILTTTLGIINEEVTVVVDNRVFEVGVYEVDNGWRPFSCSDDSMLESDDEDDENAMVFDTDGGFEDGEIGPEINTEQIPESETRRNFPLNDIEEAPASRATVSPGKLENQHAGSSKNDEDQQSQIKLNSNESPRNLNDRIEVNDVDDDGGCVTPQLSFRNIRELLPRGVFGPSRNNGRGECVESNRTLDLEMDPNGQSRSPYAPFQANLPHWILTEHRMVLRIPPPSEIDPQTILPITELEKKQLRLRQKNNVALICIQETQLQNGVDESLITNGWVDDNFGFECIEASRKSGGILTIWDRSYVSVSESIKDRFFLARYGTCSGSGINFAIVNVYAPQSIAERQGYG
ncbi:unnamed protein product [Lactuca saligna]|uniref:DUF4283 domain-containing protein n=1 Tax=Lactuca saligna TaxID=75948 RepID=A0AA36EKT2_LACSI|nr:unnamed protein product [Lactuca saligna]